MIPYGRQEIIQADVDAVTEVLNSDFLTQGPKVPSFEAKVSKKVGAKYALAVNSATSALHVACLALNIGPGDWLWTTPISFVASANCALYCGAQVDFVDIDSQTYNMSPNALKTKLARAQLENKLPKVVVVVHLCGQPCDLEEIYALSRDYGFAVIEDASHAIGAKYRGDYIGNCRYSDVTVFSFHPVKIITTGEGGMALTNNAQLAKKMDLYRSHGVTRDETRMTHKSHGPWYYQQVDLGYNYRMTDLQAALGISQFERLDSNVSRRHDLARRYDRLLKGLPVTIPYSHPDSYSAFHLYVIRLQANEKAVCHRRVFESLREQGIGVNLHYIPIHTQPYYQKMGFKYGDYPEGERYYSEAISLPMYHALTDEEQDEVIRALGKALEVARL